MTNPRRGKTLTTKIPIFTLSGGVGRQAPSKRLPSEAQELVNAMCSVERSIEKRPGTDLMSVKDFDSQAWNGDRLGVEAGADLQFFWHSLSDQIRYLIAVDRNAKDDGQKLFYTWYYDQVADYFIDQTPQTQTDAGNVPMTVRDYITYGDSVTLKTVTRGQNLVFLNPEVSAGYTSVPQTVAVGEWVIEAGDSSPSQVSGDPLDIWATINLNGNVKGDGTQSDPYVEDAVGGEVEYLTSINVDPAQIATYYDTYSPYLIGTQVLSIPGVPQGVTEGTNGITAGQAANDYFILQAKQSVSPNSDISDATLWTVISTTAVGYVPAGGNPAIDDDRIPTRIPVKDWQYPDSTKYSLGQSLPTFNDLTIPPLSVDVTDGNNNAEDMLEALYGLQDPPAAGPTNSAAGKVYYIQAGYLGESPGYYIAKSVTSPSFQKVRTPDPYSVLDDKRMPMQLEFTVDGWEWSTIEWQERTTGDADTNPGPSAFKKGRQSKITAISSFRTRLWFAVGDTIFSTRDNDFTNLWIDDPGLLVDTDPIDIAASTNKYTPITSMVPFKEYMFVNTNADTQYELEGSENKITPFTASLQPMTFYSTAPLVDPLTLGNNIFFYDAERLYMYYGYGGTLAVAQELSSHCPKYLPKNFGATAVAAAQDSILAVDADSPEDVYIFTTRYRGDQIIQNAFYRYHYEGADVQAMRSWDNFLFMVAERDGDYFIERQHMRYDGIEIPRLDRKQKIKLNVKSTPLDGSDTVNPLYDPSAYNAYFDPDAAETTIRIPYQLDLSTSYDIVNLIGASYSIKSITSTSDYSDIIVSSRFDTDEELWFGQSFTMLIQLSTQFVRGENNNPEQGVLNLASMETMHYNTGNYDVVTTRSGRPTTDLQTEYESRDPNLLPYISSFTGLQVNTFDESDLPMPSIEYQGELVSKIMGFSEKVEIYIMSDYFTPVNITNMIIRGKFRQTYSSIT